MGDDRKEAAARDDEARVWLTGLRAVQAKLGVRQVVDLSATPFFLRGSGYREGTLFPWVVSDFGLIDAIESGLVKIPRVPVDDDALAAEGPTYRQLWARISDDLPKKRVTKGTNLDPSRLPLELQGAIQSLYRNYVTSFERWQASEAADRGSAPPVFIVVCSNTDVSKWVFDHIGGYAKIEPDGTPVVDELGEPVFVPGACELFSNVGADGRWSHKPLTILVDSRQLESGEAVTADFKAAAADEVREFQRVERARNPGADVDKLSDEDLLREVMNTVGKPGRLGGEVRCVVSVSMLTEGWDANTVTHILGVRAFGTQLLCEQVVGRGLRRRSFALDDQGRFHPEYAEVYGVPFSFIDVSGKPGDDAPQQEITRVRSMADRAEATRMTFPRLDGYRFEAPDEIVFEGFDEESTLHLSPEHLPTITDVAGVVGEQTVHTLDDLRALRPQSVAFHISKLVVERYFRTDDWPEGEVSPDDVLPPSGERPWMFPQVLPITGRWLDECVTYSGGTFVGLLVLHQYASDSADKVYRSIVRTDAGDPRLLPVLKPYETVGSTSNVDFSTAKEVRRTDESRCHISHTVADSRWEFAVDRQLEESPHVVRYVKNHGLGFQIPYVIDGRARSYVPDFLVDVDDGRGPDDPLHLIIEVSGLRDREKQAKVDTAQSLWIPAVNGCGRFGRWAFAEVTDPYEAAGVVAAFAGGAGRG